jgi:hypothetical protein
VPKSHPFTQCLLTMTVRASQFIYTNVEEKLSPQGRRGSQIWLVSPDVRGEFRAQAELLLATFDKPAGTDPAVVRLLFAPLRATGAESAGPSSAYLIARFTALKAQDRFGRGGRYHAHGLIVTPEEFRKIAFDPFRLFNGFDFQEDPQKVDIQQIPGFRRGEIDPVEIECREQPQSDAPEAYRAALPDLMRLALADEGVPVIALASAPDDVASLMRALIQRMPPKARVRATFDTLCPGRGNIGVRFAGAFSKPNLNSWSFRGFLRFDPSADTPSPLVAELKQRTPAWCDRLMQLWVEGDPARDADRQLSLDLGRWLFETDGTETAPPARPSAVACLAKVEGTAGRWAEFARRSLESEVPEECQTLFRLRSISSVFTQMCSTWSVAAIDGLRGGLQLAKGNVALVKHFLTFDGAPRADQLASLRAWLEHATPQTEEEQLATLRLQGILDRWSDQGIDGFLTLLRESKIASWLREYCRGTLPEQYRRTTDVEALVERLLPTSTGDYTKKELWDWARLLYATLSSDASRESRDGEHDALGEMRLGWLLWMQGLLDINPVPLCESVQHALWVAAHYLPTRTRLAGKAVYYVTNFRGEEQTLVARPRDPGLVSQVFVGYSLTGDDSTRDREMLEWLVWALPVELIVSGFMSGRPVLALAGSRSLDLENSTNKFITSRMETAPDEAIDYIARGIDQREAALAYLQQLGRHVRVEPAAFTMDDYPTFIGFCVNTDTGVGRILTTALVERRQFYEGFFAYLIQALITLERENRTPPPPPRGHSTQDRYEATDDSG